MTPSMSLARAAFAQPSINPRIWASSSALVSTVVISRSCYFMSMQRRRRISRPLVSGGRQVLGEAFQGLSNLKSGISKLGRGQAYGLCQLI